MALVDPIITDEFFEVVERANSVLDSSFKYLFGEDEHIIKAMRDMKSANVQTYPLCAIVLPIDITKGGGRPLATIPRIVIATVTDPTKPPSTRLDAVIKPIIIPFYYEFLKAITKQKGFAVLGDRIDHRERVRYGTQQAAQGFTEYIDGIEILDLKFYLKQNCI